MKPSKVKKMLAFALAPINRVVRIRSSAFLVFLAVSLVGLLGFFFQNCGEGFQVTSSSKLELSQDIEILISPTDHSFYLGDSSEFSAVVLSRLNQPLIYQWKKEGRPLEGQTSFMFVVNNIKEEDQGSYSLEVSSETSEGVKKVESPSFFLKVSPAPSQSIIPEVANLVEGHSVAKGGVSYFRIKAGGYPRPSVQWYKDSQAIPDATKEYLLFPQVSDSDEGVYFAKVSNLVGSVDSEPSLLVVNKTEVAPFLYDGSSHQFVAVGQAFEVGALFLGLPVPQYKWSLRGKTIDGQNSRWLKVLHAEPSHSGKYQIEATNSVGKEVIEIEVTVVDRPMVLKSLSDQIVPIHSNVSFDYQLADSEVAPKISWFKDGQILSGVQGETLELKDVTKEDEGKYRIRAENIAGVLESEASLIVVDLPLIKLNPQSLMLEEKDMASLSVQAEGVGLSFSWFKNDKMIVGASSSVYQIPLTSYLDEADYYVEVKNIAGIKKSSIAELRVNLVRDGSRLYDRDCSSCHSPSDKPLYGKTFQEMKQAILTVNSMEGLRKNFFSRLSDEQIGNIAQYFDTCNPTQKPLASSQMKKCSDKLGSNYLGSYTENIDFVCEMRNYVPRYEDNSATSCQQTCDPSSRPPDITEQISCAEKFGPTYKGTYSTLTSFQCQGVNWVAALSDNSASACGERQCPQVSTGIALKVLSCAERNPSFSGNFIQSTDQVCDEGSWSWKTITSDDFESKCQPFAPQVSKIARGADGSLVISEGETAFIDKSLDVTTLVIEGTLLCGTQENVEIKANTIMISGKLLCGSETSPFKGNLTISLKHDPNNIPRTGMERNGAEFNPNWVKYRGLIVHSGGRLELHGENRGGVLKLLNAAEPGQTRIYVSDRPNWRIGDTIALAGTSYFGDEEEHRTISNIVGNVVDLNGPLAYHHWGSIYPQTYETQRGPEVLDQRGEIVNLTRNIRIQADDPADQLKFFEEDFQLGGHVMIHRGGFAQIDGVEFFKMGQAGMMARYPFHWHLLGDAPGQYIKNSSIHESFQRCVVVHGTNKTLVENNSCYRFRGHGYFLEDGNEVDNIMTRNIGMGGRLPFLSKILLASDDIRKGSIRRFLGPSVFWISHPQNTIVDNIAAGSTGTGFWNSFEEGPARTSATVLYARNIAHSSPIGHTWDGARVASANANNPNNPEDREINSAHYSPSQIPRFDDLVTYRASQAAIYFRGQTAVFQQNISADCGWHYFLAYNQIVRKSTIIGYSVDNPVSTKEEKFLIDMGISRQIGAILYDGPLELDNIDFLNFPQNVVGRGIEDTSNPIGGGGGSEKTTNITKSLRFSPEPRFRLSIGSEVATVWSDSHLSQGVRDLDGTLTGLAGGGSVLGGVPFSRHPECQLSDQFVNAAICPFSTQFGQLYVESQQYNWVHLPQILRRSDGVTSLTPDEMRTIVNRPPDNRLYRKTTLISNPVYSYELLLGKDFSGLNKNGDLIVHYRSEVPDGLLSPVINLKNYGFSCRMSGAPEHSTLASLESSSEAGYFSDGNSIFFRIRAAFPLGYISPRQDLSGYSQILQTTLTLSCDSDLVQEIQGVIDNIDESGSIMGWACNYGSSDSIAIHVYAGGPAGSGAFVTQAFADKSSEDAVGFACADPLLKPHRFHFKIPESVDPGVYRGKKIYLHGINSRDNGLLSNSGKFLIN